MSRIKGPADSVSASWFREVSLACVLMEWKGQAQHLSQYVVFNSVSNGGNQVPYHMSRGGLALSLKQREAPVMFVSTESTVESSEEVPTLSSPS